MSYFDVSTCATCRPGKLCDQHTSVMKDGGVIRVPMMMMDSMQRSVSADPAARVLQDSEAREQARRDHEEWLRKGQPIQHDGISDYHARALAMNARSNAATLADAQRLNAVTRAVNDHAGNARDRAYAASCAAFDRTPKEA